MSQASEALLAAADNVDNGLQDKPGDAALVAALGSLIGLANNDTPARTLAIAVRKLLRGFDSIELRALTNCYAHNGHIRLYCIERIAQGGLVEEAKLGRIEAAEEGILVPMVGEAQ